MSQSPELAQIEAWLLAGDHQQATEACLDLLAEHPGDPDLLTFLALCDETAGRLDDAERRLSELVEAHPEHVRCRFHLARIQLSQGQTQKAQELLETCVALSPNHAPSRTLLARLAHQRGASEEAIEGLKVALKADSDYVPALCDLAIVYVEMGDVASAERYASQAVKVDAEDGAAQLAMGLVMEAKGHLSFALQCLLNATDRDPDSVQATMALSRVYQQQGQHQRAIETLDRLSDAAKSALAARYARAFSLVRLNQLAPARILYEGILAEKPDPKSALQLMDLYIQMNDFEALMALSQSLDRTDGGVAEVASFLEARIAEFQGQFEVAHSALQPLVNTTLRDLWVRVQLVLARLALRQGHAEEAQHHLADLLEAGPWPYRLLWEIAQLAEQAQAPELGLRAIDQVLEGDGWPSEVKARSATMRFHLLDRLGRYAEATEQLQNETIEMGWLPMPPGLTSQPWPAINRDELIKGDHDPSLPRVIWVPGWPWAGRDLVLAALAQLEGAYVLPMGDGSMRHEHLGLILNQPLVLGKDLTQIESMRRRYLRHIPEGTQVVVEPFPCKAQDLLRLYQVFPKAQVVRVLADEGYLRLQWHLSGYQPVGAMIEAWQAEQALLDQFTQQGLLSIASIGMSELLDDDKRMTALESLMTQLSADANPKMAQHIKALIQRHAYRSSNHWQHYF